VTHPDDEERELAATLGLDRERAAIGAGELQRLAEELEADAVEAVERASVAKTRAAACRAGGVALLAGRRGA
jgi:hypothetical protein